MRSLRVTARMLILEFVQQVQSLKVAQYPVDLERFRSFRAGTFSEVAYPMLIAAENVLNCLLSSKHSQHSI